MLIDTILTFFVLELKLKLHANVWTENTIAKRFKIKVSYSQVYGSNCNMVLYNGVSEVLRGSYLKEDELTLKLSSTIIGLNSIHQKIKLR